MARHISHRRGRRREFVHVTTTRPAGLDPACRAAIVQGVEELLREGCEVEVQVNGFGTIVRGGDVRAIVRMLERHDIGVEVR